MPTLQLLDEVRRQAQPAAQWLELLADRLALPREAALERAAGQLAYSVAALPTTL